MSLDVWLVAVRPTTVFSGNITHNMAEMARFAGIYEYLWRPEEVDVKVAVDLIKPLTKGLEDLREFKEQFKELNPANGWGNYDVFVEFVQNYLDACIENPAAIVNASR